ncbi:MAG: FkbM family methyltransferase [Chloroflexi bacterium]|nr:FkbM family methyltransferase [Chloroflexota bacterium]
MRARLRRYAISGRVPRPLLRARSLLLYGPLPPRLTIPAFAWTSYLLAKPELRVLRTLVDPTRPSVDVGANVGVHTYFLARWTQHVYAYEPNPMLAQRLRHGHLSNVSVSGLALSDRAGEATLFVPRIRGEDADPYGSLERRAEELGSGPEAASRHEVLTNTLDAQRHRDVGLVKIDVEGHEAAVIAGAAETLQRDRPVLLVELEQRHSAADIRDVIDGILAVGYRGYFLDGRALADIEDFSVEQHQTIPLAEPGARGYVENFVFVARDAASLRRSA